MQKRMVIISGFSGTGKTTVIAKLEGKSHLELVKSHTTRPLRHEHEFYYSISTTKFEELIKEKKFAEYNKYAGNYYGTSYEEIDRVVNKNNIPILEIDTNGLSQIIEKTKDDDIEIQTIFIAVDGDTLYDRLRKRGTEDKEKIIRRLKTALQEVEKLQMYQYVFLNKDIDTTVKDILRAINHESVMSQRFNVEEFSKRVSEIISKLEEND